MPDKFKDIVRNFSRQLQAIYGDGLVSVILYGSAASGEFIDKHSNLNLLIVLKSTDLENLQRASSIINRFRMINPLFLTEDYIQTSTDIFPIEFLDMQENYALLFGKDVLKDMHIDTRNLRFQCEQELKAKLLNLRQAYLRANKNKSALRHLLFRSFTSVLHILRNVLRIKGKNAPYKKEDILKELASDFSIDIICWQKILAVKNKEIKLSKGDSEALFVHFVRDLEKIVDSVDKL